MLMISLVFIPLAWWETLPFRANSRVARDKSCGKARRRRARLVAQRRAGRPAPGASVLRLDRVGLRHLGAPVAIDRPDEDRALAAGVGLLAVLADVHADRLLGLV